MVLGVYYPTEEKRVQYQHFFSELYSDRLLMCASHRIITKDNLLIVFVKHPLDLCGHRLDNYVIIGGEENCPDEIIRTIKICTLN